MQGFLLEGECPHEPQTIDIRISNIKHGISNNEGKMKKRSDSNIPSLEIRCSVLDIGYSRHYKAKTRTDSQPASLFSEN
jgi:hypothetical protein